MSAANEIPWWKPTLQNFRKFNLDRRILLHNGGILLTGDGFDLFLRALAPLLWRRLSFGNRLICRCTERPGEILENIHQRQNIRGQPGRDEAIALKRKLSFNLHDRLAIVFQLPFLCYIWWPSQVSSSSVSFRPLPDLLGCLITSWSAKQFVLG